MWTASEQGSICSSILSLTVANPMHPRKLQVGHEYNSLILLFVSSMWCYKTQLWQLNVEIPEFYYILRVQEAIASV